MTEQSISNPPSLTAFDDMDTRQLEQLLRDDLLAEKPLLEERELRYITELLARRKPSPALLPAWNNFQNHYMQTSLLLEDRDRRRLHWQRLTAAAAALVLILTLPVASLALVSNHSGGYRASWDTTSFHFHWKRNAIPDRDQWQLASASAKELQEAGLYPTWIPYGFVPNTYNSGIDLDVEHYRDGYINEDATFRISLYEVDPKQTRSWSVDGETVQVYQHNNIKFYLFRHGEQAGACWVKAGLECSIEGDLSEEQIKKMIHSLKNY
jgi:hypothetical protein